MLALVPGVLALVLIAAASRLAGATSTAITGAFEPLTAVVACCLLLGEPFTFRLVAGIILILTAVLLVILNRKQKSSPSLIHPSSVPPCIEIKIKTGGEKGI